MKRKPQPPVTAISLAEALAIEGLKPLERAYLEVPLGRPIELADAVIGRHAKQIRRLHAGA